MPDVTYVIVVVVAVAVVVVFAAKEPRLAEVSVLSWSLLRPRCFIFVSGPCITACSCDLAIHRGNEACHSNPLYFAVRTPINPSIPSCFTLTPMPPPWPRYCPASPLSSLTTSTPTTWAAQRTHQARWSLSNIAAGTAKADADRPGQRRPPVSGGASVFSVRGPVRYTGEGGGRGGAGAEAGAGGRQQQRLAAVIQ